jgi:flagellum-specific ATP synthase
MTTIFLDRARSAVRSADPIRASGVVTKVVGLALEATGPQAPIGEVCRIRTSGGEIRAEVVGFREGRGSGRTILMPIGEAAGVAPGNEVVGTGAPLRVKVGRALLGRVLDGLGRPIDDAGPIGLPGDDLDEAPAERDPPDPVRRPRIKEALALGVRSIDACLTVGRGQRLGIFSGSGVGKSTLLGMMARFTSADVNVIALVGERGREVRDFIERDLGDEGLKRSVVVVATSDQPPLLRLRAAFVATAIAEHFRDRGRDVLFMMDSVTRFARAQREVGLAAGEPPAQRGFTPSVFAILPRLLERTGTSERGTITGLYTILVDADDMNEPVADNVRGILDGHVVLSRTLAERGQYPAVDVLASISRLMPEVVADEHVRAALALKEILAVYRDAEDLVNIGAYVPGSNPRIDRALAKIEAANAFLRQGIFERADFADSARRLAEIAGDAPAATVA